MLVVPVELPVSLGIEGDATRELGGLRVLGGKFRSLSELSRDAQFEDKATWPQVILIEPDYEDSPVHMSGHASDNHPPLAMAFGESLLLHVRRTRRQREA